MFCMKGLVTYVLVDVAMGFSIMRLHAAAGSMASTHSNIEASWY